MAPLVISFAACAPATLNDAGSGDGAVEASAIVEDVLADGRVDCDEHVGRNQFNACPDAPPGAGLDDAGVAWSRDRLFFGLIPNPLHPGLDCFRGTSAGLGVSSYHCCYDGARLVAGGRIGSSFDFFNPGLRLVQHVLYDVLPEYRCGPPVDGPSAVSE